AECNNTGYRGRIGVFEALVLDDELDKLLRTLPSESDIQAVQKKRPLMTMIEDGVIKVLNGVTTLAELDRVVELDA
ncbi:MAG: type pilus assembly ATPase PilB, type pilus assembly protein PilB, partial [Candidatus Parcubacteria bacterium]